jgi:hypothetical protein
MANSARVFIFLLALSVGGEGCFPPFVASDPATGIFLTATVTAPPEPACVRAALTAVPEVTRVDTLSSGSDFAIRIRDGAAARSHYRVRVSQADSIPVTLFASATWIGRSRSATDELQAERLARRFLASALGSCAQDSGRAPTCLYESAGQVGRCPSERPA